MMDRAWSGGPFGDTGTCVLAPNAVEGATVLGKAQVRVVLA